MVELHNTTLMKITKNDLDMNEEVRYILKAAYATKMYDTFFLLRVILYHYEDRQKDFYEGT